MVIKINWKKYKILKSLKWWKTNIVLLSENEEWKKILIKKIINKNYSLQREVDFFWYVSDNNIEWFPKLLDTDNWNKTIILEFKEWENWQDIDISKENWEILWEDFWKKLLSLHNNKIELTNNERKKAIYNMINYFDIWEDDLIFFKDNFNNKKEKLKILLENDNEDFVMNHWDFSPHNCLFTKNNNWNYIISTILDPSLRAWYWSKYFDIIYLLNTRHNKYKENFEKWFFKIYEVNKNLELFLKFDEVMKMYLIELYNLMDLKKDSINLYEKYMKNYKN